MNKNFKHIVHLVYIITFFLMLLLPSIFSNFGVGSKVNCENRTLVKKPKFVFHLDYLKQYGDYFEDNYGFRNDLMYFQSYFKYQYFNSSSNPDEILLGKNNWMFYTSKPDSSYCSYSRTNLYNQKRLVAYKTLHQKREKLLEKKGIKYIMAVWPAPSTIYPEMLPFQMKLQIKDTMSKIDQVASYFKKEKIEIPFIDVRQTLIEHKQENLYQKYDTHWNSLGAYYGYCSFMNQTKNILKQDPYPLSDFRKVMVKSVKQGLFNMIGLCQQSNYIEMLPEFVFKKEKLLKDDKFYPGSYGKTLKNAPSNLRVLFFRDSYSSYLIQFFSLHFKETYFYWSDYNQEIVDRVKPDVVIVASTERYF